MTHHHLVSACALSTFLIGSPALAGGQAPQLAYDPVPPAETLPYEEAHVLPPGADQDPARAEWLDRCRTHYQDNGLGGALIGGAVGGIAGNRIAGRGNRTVGTIAGAAVGAMAGAAIDKAEDRGRARDACEDYLDRYTAYYAAGGSGPGYYQGNNYDGYSPYGYGAGYIMVPVRVNRGCKQREVIEEIVDVPVARRVIPRRPADKRIRYIK